MRDYPYHVYVESDRKHMYILPSVSRLHDGVGIIGYVFYKLKYSDEISLRKRTSKLLTDITSEAF